MFKDQLINKVIRTRVEAARAKKVMLPKEVVRKRNLSFRVLFFDVYLMLFFSHIYKSLLIPRIPIYLLF